MNKSLRLLPTLLLFATSAHAHDGHGVVERSGSWLHYVLEPVHLPVTLLAVGILLVGGRWTFRRLERSMSSRRR